MPNETVYFPTDLYDGIQDYIESTDAQNFSQGVQDLCQQSLTEDNE